MKESASQYADRVIGLMISLTGIIFFVGYIIPAVDWSNVDFSWWQLLAVVNVALIFVVFAGSFFFAYRVQWLLWLVIILLFSFLLLSMFLGPAKIQMNSDVTWIWALQSAVINFLVLLRGLKRALVLTLFISLLPAISSLIYTGEVAKLILTDASVHMGDIILIVLIGAMRAKLLKRETSLQETYEQQRKERLRVSELETIEKTSRIVHDRVLSVLVFAGLKAGYPSASLRKQAKEYLRLQDGDTGLSDIWANHNAALFADEFVTMLKIIDPLAKISTTFTPGEVPLDVIERVADAASEALRNKVLHTESTTQASIEAFFSSDLVEVKILDNGGGFDLAKIDPNRLGVRASILGRFRDLPGGAARISFENENTLVELSWHAT